MNIQFLVNVTGTQEKIFIYTGKFHVAETLCFTLPNSRVPGARTPLCCWSWGTRPVEANPGSRLGGDLALSAGIPFSLGLHCWKFIPQTSFLSRAQVFLSRPLQLPYL